MLARILSLIVALLVAAPAPAQDAAANLAVVIVSTGYNASATSIALTAGHGARLPTAPYNCAWYNATSYPGGINSSGTIDPNYEIVRVTARSTDTLTVTRAQEGTSASTKNTGGATYVMQCGLTAARFTTINDALAAQFVTTASTSALANEAVLTGTANQVIVTGATLSTPQNLHTAATPTFGGLTLSNLTSGRVPYASTGGLFADDAELFWDATNNVLKLSSAWTPTRDALALQMQRTVTTPPDTAPGAVRAIVNIQGIFAQAGAVNQGRIGLGIGIADDASVRNQPISGAASDGSGANEIRITATSHGFANGDRINVYSVGGTTEANGVWTIGDVTTNTFDLVGSTFTNAYTSGGEATNRGLMYGMSITATPRIDRGYTSGGPSGTGANGDDVALLTLANGSTTDGVGVTDAVWVTDAAPTNGSRAFNSILASDSGANYFISYFGKAHVAGIDVSGATLNASSVPMFKLGSGHNFELDAAGNGTKWGTSTSQKQAWWNATPIAQPSSTTELKDGVLGGLGLMATGGAAPLDLDGGALTAGSATVSGNVTVDTSTLVVDAANNRVGIGTASPAAQLHGSLDGTNTLFWDSYGSSSVIRYRRGNGTAAAITRVASGDSLGAFQWWGAAKDDTSSGATFANSSATIRATAAQNFTTTGRQTFFEFLPTALNATAVSTSAVISTTGFVATTSSTLVARGTTDGGNTFRCFNAVAAPSGTLTNGGDVYCEGGEVKAMDSAGNAHSLTSPEQQQTLTILNPTGAENFGGIRFNRAVTITKVVAVLQGSSTPSVTWQVRHGTDRSAAGADTFTANKTTTSTTTGAVETSTFNDATVAADEFLWLATTAQSGTVTALHVTIFYTVD